MEYDIGIRLDEIIIKLNYLVEELEKAKGKKEDKHEEKKTQ